ncbi:CRISPR-associated endonuclease Cas2 [Haloferax sp. MBLA0076]|uniref:CRISPR-associated endoribonuclease Cas2 n=1 Tax=Haloferax litoreum TaxID=2666140 RepID=A0A6A8GG79_9EURY|nr:MULTISPECIES: CRISPR-associated endonuclease Cas2 [Haloferax]KAB1193633.1 CRISPR-associated endonuclease Cas2 [Haloferax sp. CBA1148]MRX22158.1 CRISPR-associated endonuclease Cas2 [Haloferax litoreum]
MYVVLVYDMEADRTQKMLRLSRRYLTHVQNSVLEGEISAGDLEELRGHIEALLKDGESVVLYELSSDSLLNRTVYGEDPTEDSRFI